MIDIDPAQGCLSLRTGAPSRPAGGWQIRTGSGGEHRWFSHPGITIRNSAGQLGPGIDVRGDGGTSSLPIETHHRRRIPVG